MKGLLRADQNPEYCLRPSFTLNALAKSRLLGLNLSVFTQHGLSPDPLAHALELLNKGMYEDALREGTRLLDQDLPRLSKGSLRFILGASNNELGNIEQSILNFLEGYAIIATENQPAMMGHFQDELARVLFRTGHLNASLFFVEMAISNFELEGNIEMTVSCKKLKEQLLRTS